MLKFSLSHAPATLTDGQGHSEWHKNTGFTNEYHAKLERMWSIKVQTHVNVNLNRSSIFLDSNVHSKVVKRFLVCIAIPYLFSPWSVEICVRKWNWFSQGQGYSMCYVLEEVYRVYRHGRQNEFGRTVCVPCAGPVFFYPCKTNRRQAWQMDMHNWRHRSIHYLCKWTWVCNSVVTVYEICESVSWGRTLIILKKWIPFVSYAISKDRGGGGGNYLINIAIF